MLRFNRRNMNKSEWKKILNQFCNQPETPTIWIVRDSNNIGHVHQPRGLLIRLTPNWKIYQNLNRNPSGSTKRSSTEVGYRLYFGTFTFYDHQLHSGLTKSFGFITINSDPYWWKSSAQARSSWLWPWEPNLTILAAASYIGFHTRCETECCSMQSNSMGFIWLVDQEHRDAILCILDNILAITLVRLCEWLFL